jgi:uncharacterized protein YdbL (DUF1318 family)
MTEASALQELTRKVGDLQATMLTLLNRRLSRQDLADRLGITTRTLSKRIDAGQVPQPVNGKWLLSEIVEWEKNQ